ncbi:MAG: mechanosensitive ion channel domain-containing protein [Myxococcota bacterium]
MRHGWVILCGIVASSAPAQAQLRLPGQAEAAEEHDQAETLRAAQQALASETAQLATSIQRAAAENAPERARALTLELEALERIGAIQTQLLVALHRGDELAEERQGLDDDLHTAARGVPVEEPPYNLAALDRLNERAGSETRRETTLAAAVKAAADALEQVQRTRDDAAAALAQRTRAATRSPDDPTAQRALRDQELATRAANLQDRLREVELDNERNGLTLQRLKQQLLAHKVAWVRDHLTPTPGDVEATLVRIDREAFNLKNDLNTAKLELSAGERRMAEARTRLDAATGPDIGLVEEVAARRLALMTGQQAVTLHSERLERLEKFRVTWRRRHAALAGAASNDDLSLWEGEARVHLDELERRSLIEAARIAELRSARGALLSRMAHADGAGSAAMPWLREQDRRLENLIQIYEADLAGVNEIRRVTYWHVDELHSQVSHSLVSDRFGAVWDALVDLWRYRITTIEDHPITVGKLLSAILLFVIGFLASRFLSRLLGRRLLPRFGLHTGASAALQTLTFYVLFVFFALFALRMVNVPLTVFTVLGGALAIGVGFGSQNIVNNFISGLILLIEQPIKVDDLIEVDGTLGKVEHIGARSTRVRTFANIHILVPNSAFLEKNVVNWTLSDPLVRVEVNVGVAYGSPTRDVHRLIHQAIEEHSDVQKHPEPLVFFTAFGDNALHFEALFWIRISSHIDRRRIQSDIRFRIDELFRETEIVIAFPQRDVHLDTIKPLEVRVVDGK